MTTAPLAIDLDDVRRAAERLRGHVQHTPTVLSRTLSAITGCELFVKLEQQQYTASFKERGALNRLLNIDDEARRRGVIAVSAGNHAQGVAYHAARLGIPGQPAEADEADRAQWACHLRGGHGVRSSVLARMDR